MMQNNRSGTLNKITGQPVSYCLVSFFFINIFRVGNLGERRVLCLLSPDSLCGGGIVERRQSEAYERVVLV